MLEFYIKCESEEAIQVQKALKSLNSPFRLDFVSLV